VIDLCEYALECVEDATGRVDDSDGQMGDIRETAHRAAITGHASRRVRVPRSLPSAFSTGRIHSDWETLIDGAGAYADVLRAKRGSPAYRALAEEVWDHVPGTCERQPRGSHRFTCSGSPT